MLLLAALLATAICSYGFAQEIPMQSPISITRSKGTARLYCHVKDVSEDFGGLVIHWYQQKEGKAPQRLLFFSSGSASVDSGFQANRYMVEKVSGQKRCVLTIKDVIPDDAATYYCAYWDEYYKVFGTGTKLIVSDKGNSAPENAEVLRKQHGDQITYVCLIEKFYPDVIRVTWNDGEKEVTDNVVKGDAWKATEDDKYSISSWLTVPAENKDKKYLCKYEHEGKQDSKQAYVEPTKPKAPEENCITYPGNGTDFNRDHLMHRTAYLVYIVLLLKSSMYYLIVLFFIYRMWSPNKHQGKKA
ncbi:immunoglobulin kappa light chain-like [Grus americana]|uniref:immunoglobulin kappa light chain-like n=1 Tax=Grus americana TaxID=9117 RepID=UPI002407FF11|nr:immunoglobulin kappa light chain-like [Grus americana]